MWPHFHNLWVGKCLCKDLEHQGSCGSWVPSILKRIWSLCYKPPFNAHTLDLPLSCHTLYSFIFPRPPKEHTIITVPDFQNRDSHPTIISRLSQDKQEVPGQLVKKKTCLHLYLLAVSLVEEALRKKLISRDEPVT